ncbi:MAG: SufD family Fe-S cluster assembly protein [Thaumarchaeota archaeon]|nr:SufD family Fe-S cluster assembly protein [Nitrososphaerota archaeon]
MQHTTLSKLSSDYVLKLSSSLCEPEWLSEYRKNSINIYNKLGDEVSPLYNKYSDASKMDHNQIRLSNKSQSVIPDFIKNRIHELDNTANIIQIGSNIHQIYIPNKIKLEDLHISSIHEAIKNDENSKINKLFQTIDPKKDKYVALNNAAFDSGISINVPDNVNINEPIHIICCLNNNISTISRHIINVGENSNLEIIQEIYAPESQTQNAYIELLDSTVSSNSKLTFTSLQVMNQKAVNFSTRRNTINVDGKANYYLGLFGAMLSRYKINHHLVGSGSTVNDYEVIFGDHNQSFDISSNVHHEKPSTTAKIIEKSILKDQSKSLFKGMIRINEQANKSQSFLSGRSILLSKNAKSDAIPSLEILTNDVKATHSASVSQIDDELIFYIQSRCLTKEDAERIIIEGFLEPMSRNMSYQARAWIAYLIESKWNNQDLTIHTNEQLKKLVEIEETRYNEIETELEKHYKYR